MFVVAMVLSLATAARFYLRVPARRAGDRRPAPQPYSHLLSLDQRFFERTRSGELLSRLSADAELLRSVVGSSMSIACAARSLSPEAR
jgi:ATP-binding cassette subfamily B protein